MSDKHRGFIERELFSKGIGEVAVLRQKNRTTFEMGLFLVDTHCCGVKNVIYTLVETADLDAILSRSFDDPTAHEVQAGEARHLVESAVAYAGRHGLPPHRDYRKACRVFGGLTALAPKVPWKFGLNGKPFYVQGPHDSLAFVEGVVRSLKASVCNEFDYLIELEMADRLARHGVELPEARSRIVEDTDQQ